MLAMTVSMRLAQRVLDTLPLVMRHLFSSLREIDHHIEPNQFQTLALLAEGEHSITELAARQMVSLPSVSKSVNMLVDRGWIERVALANDRRVCLLRLTVEGRRSLEMVHEAMTTAVAEVMAGLTPEECATISAGLDVLSCAFGGGDEICTDKERKARHARPRVAMEDTQQSDTRTIAALPSDE